MIDKVIDRLCLIWKTSRWGKIDKDKNAINWGIIGTGYMAQTFSRGIVYDRFNTLYAVSSRDLIKAKSFCKKYGVLRPYDDIEKMLSDDKIDVIYIATPVECHYENIIQCLNANKHVLCEKPLTLSSKEAIDAFKLAKEKQLVLMEGMWSMLLPTMSKAEEWLKNDKIGAPCLIRADLNKRVSKNHIETHKGVLYDYGVYGIAFMQRFMGSKAITISVLKRGLSKNLCSDWMIQYKSDNLGGELNIMSNYSAPSKAVIIGERGSIEWDSPFNRTNMIRLFDNQGNMLEEYSINYCNEGFEYELKKMVALIQIKSEAEIKRLNEETIERLLIIESLQHG